MNRKEYLLTSTANCTRVKQEVKWGGTRKPGQSRNWVALQSRSIAIRELPTFFKNTDFLTEKMIVRQRMDGVDRAEDLGAMRRERTDWEPTRMRECAETVRREPTCGVTGPLNSTVNLSPFLPNYCTCTLIKLWKGYFGKLIKPNLQQTAKSK